MKNLIIAIVLMASANTANALTPGQHVTACTSLSDAVYVAAAARDNGAPLSDLVGRAYKTFDNAAFLKLFVNLLGVIYEHPAMTPAMARDAAFLGCIQS